MLLVLIEIVTHVVGSYLNRYTCCWFLFEIVTYDVGSYLKRYICCWFLF